MRSRLGKISAIQPIKAAPDSLERALSGNRPLSGGGAPGIPPKNASAVQTWSTTVAGFKLLNNVRRRACSVFVSRGVRGVVLWGDRGGRGARLGGLGARLGSAGGCDCRGASELSFRCGRGSSGEDDIRVGVGAGGGPGSAGRALVLAGDPVICITMKFPLVRSAFPFRLLGMESRWVNFRDMGVAHSHFFESGRRTPNVPSPFWADATSVVLLAYTQQRGQRVGCVPTLRRGHWS
jgi:hypothetical protein